MYTSNPLIDEFLDSMLDTVRAQNSASTIKIVGQGMLRRQHTMTFTDVDLLNALICKVGEWLPGVMSTEDMRGHTFLTKACASIAYLAVGTDVQSNVEHARTSLDRWEAQLRADGNDLDKNMAEDLKTYKTSILDKKCKDWRLVTG